MVSAMIMRVTILLTSLIFSCHQAPEKKEFKIPFVKQEKTMDTIMYARPQSICYPVIPFAGKYAFCDTLNIPLQWKADSNLLRDIYYESETRKIDSIGNDGFEIFTDYKTNVTQKDLIGTIYYYPVYIVNQTPTAKLFIGKDRRVFAIQEALDSNGSWGPIEGPAFDFCGNGYWGMKINSGEFATILMPKYRGTFKTKLRIRLLLNNSIYVSKPFEGFIDARQIYFHKKDPNRNSLERMMYYEAWRFYGAIPLEDNTKD